MLSCAFAYLQPQKQQFIPFKLHDPGHPEMNKKQMGSLWLEVFKNNKLNDHKLTSTGL